MNIIETHALSRVYGKRRAVDSLDMCVAAGEIYGFVGKNGAGKSTAMKMIAGLVRPTSGSVELFGAQRRAREGFSRVGALIEDPGILPTFSALENLMCKALALGVVRPNAHCRELLELVGLADTGSLRVKKFSLGMKQRLGLALALVGGPDLLLLDEPFNGLDPESTRAMRGALVRLNRERGRDHRYLKPRPRPTRPHGDEFRCDQVGPHGARALHGRPASGVRQLHPH